MFEHIYYHIGIAARVYHEAAEHYAKVLDVKFTEPAESVLYIENPQTQQAETVKVAVMYSRNRPPYVELLRVIVKCCVRRYDQAATL